MGTELTPDQIKAGKRSLSATIITAAVICFTTIFCFAKIEETARETKQIEELKVRKIEAEARLLRAEKGLPEYRPLSTSYRTVAFSTAYTPSSTRFTLVFFPTQIVSSLTLTTGQSGTVNIQISDNTGANFTTRATMTNNNTGTLVVGVNTNNTQGGGVTLVVPPNCSYQMITSGTSTFSLPVSSTQETFL